MGCNEGKPVRPTIAMSLNAPAISALLDADVSRIAVAVVDEQERRASSPFAVTPDDVRRWCPELQKRER